MFKQKFQSHLKNDNVASGYRDDLNQMNIVQSKHISKEQRIIYALNEMNQLLAQAMWPNTFLSQSGIEKLLYLAQNIILDYYHCKLENQNFTMTVTQQDNSIFVNKIGNTQCCISLTNMQSNLRSIKKVAVNNNQTYNVDPIKKYKLTNFLYKVKHFDTIYNNSPNYFNQTFIFNAKCDSNTDIIKDCLSKSPLGLQNIGSTCYMNATLQSFLHDPDTRDYFLLKKHKQFNSKTNLINQKNPSLSYSFMETLNSTNNEKSVTSIAPRNFKDVISELNPLFEGVQANDAKDLVNFIIMTMHEELNKPQQPLANDNDIVINGNDHDAILRNFMQDFSLKNRSFISDNYYALHETRYECFGCHHIKYNFQVYFFLVFPLEEVRKFRELYIQNSNNTNMTVTLNDCFLYNTEYNLMSGQNEMYCDICQLNKENLCTTKLFTVPKTLILLLNRGVGLQFNIKLEFTEYLDQYTIDSNLDPTMKWIYKRLSSVITHLGENGSGGHFISHTISQTDGLRYKFNDAIVSKEENFEKEVIDLGMPYLLFYTDMDPHDMIRFILSRVTDFGYRDSISGMFESLTQKQQSRFAYLLMRAADNDNIYNYSTNQMNGYGQVCLSNLICATFELIKTGKSFDDDYMEQCRIIICEMANQMQFFTIQTPTIDNLIIWMSSKVKNSNIEQEQIIYFKVNIVQNNEAYVELDITNNQNNINIIINNNNNFNWNNNIITQSNIDDKSSSNENDEDSQYDPNAAEFPKYKPASKSKFSWLKFSLAAIFAVATIVLIILELYLIALIPFVFMFLPFVIPKLCKSCCGCFYPINSSYYNKDPLSNGNNNDYKQPQSSINQNIINNQIQN